MNKIKKERKGVIFDEMSNYERQLLIDARTEGRRLIYFNFSEGEWRTCEMNFCNGNIYWCKDWDINTEEELIGKWCKCWDNEKNYVVGKILKFSDKSDYPYHLYNDNFAFAEEITDKKVLNYLEK